MSDPEESTPAECTPSETPTQEMNSSSIIRYSKETLLSLHDSPLVAKPPDMPPLSTWFSDDNDAYISKSILNGSPASTRMSTANNTLDKNVLLAPNKSIFSSASYDKRQEDALNNGRGSLTSRYRPMNDDGRARDHNNMSNNKERSLRTGDRNFMRGDKNDRRSTHNNHSNPMSSNNNNSSRKHHHSHQQQQHDRLNGNDNLSSRLRKDNRPARAPVSDNTTTTTRGSSSSSDRVPEWMDYSPVTEQSGTMNQQDMPIAPRPESGLDLEAWKQDMKQREEQDAGNETAIQPNPVASATASSDLEMLLGVGSLSLQQQQQQQQQQQLKPTNGGSPSISSNGSPMDILSASIFDTNTGSPLLSTGRRERGSRFAKFFARREEEAAAASTPTPQQPEPQARSISVDDLFGSKGGSSGLGGIAVGNGSSPSAMSVPTSDSPGNVRMLSEEEVLRTLGAKRDTPDQLNDLQTPSPPQQQQPSSADGLGFDKVLQILSQPKPAAPGQPHPQPQSPATTVASVVDSESIKESLSEHKPTTTGHDDRSATASPSLSSSTDKAAPQQRDEVSSESSSSQQQQQAHTVAAKPKLMNSRFAGNLPTSVLRQMSARSSEGRSPSIASAKSGTARSSLGASSPALSNRSPALPKNSLPESSPVIGHHSPNGIAYAQTAPGFHHQHHRMPPSPAYPFSAGSPVGASAAAHHPHGPAPPPPPHPMSGMPGGNMRQQQPPRSDPALEQLFQYDNASPLAGSRGAASGPMNPMIPPQMTYAQQQQGMDHQFIPPPQHHMMQHPMPPHHHMPPVANPMLPPHHHHHLPPHLQGQLPPQFMQRDMMTPPAGALGNMPPPHMMANGNAGLPPHLFTKSPGGGGGGWDRH